MHFVRILQWIRMKWQKGVCHDLLTFRNQFGLAELSKRKGIQYTSFIAAFKEPGIQNQLHGAELLFTLLHNMHQHDRKYFSWAQTISSDIDSEDFGFSIGSEGYFLPLLYPYSSSKARRSDITMVVFNAHSIFEKLRETGGFEKLKTIIRNRQGIENVHPHLGNHGEVNEWRQYALVDPDPVMQQQVDEAVKKIMGDCPFQQK